MRTVPAPLSIVALLACVGCAKAPPPADPEFSDALIFLLRAFEGPQADLAFAARDLESQTNADLDVTSNNTNDRALAPAFLTDADVADIERTNTDRDIARALPVAVAGLSDFPPEDHAALQLMPDQTLIEPYSPDKYDRTFTEGKDCFGDRSCDTLRTWNVLTKDNLLMTIDYELGKDFRWIDLNLPDPSEVPEGEEPRNDGEPRWAMLARSWTSESFAGRGDKNYIHQSYTIELWIPRKQSEEGRTLRLLSLWSETEIGGLNVSDDQIIATTRAGIDRNFRAVDDYLEGK